MFTKLKMNDPSFEPWWSLILVSLHLLCLAIILYLIIVDYYRVDHSDEDMRRMDDSNADVVFGHHHEDREIIGRDNLRESAEEFRGTRQHQSMNPRRRQLLEPRIGSFRIYITNDRWFDADI